MNWFQLQWRLFLVAVQFLTRVPVVIPGEFDPRWLSRCCVYFPVVGSLIGLAAAAVYLLCVDALGTTIGVMLSMAASVLITGAFHEDGLADTCDGLGGGLDCAHKLRIMKDSRIGTYGAIGLFMVLMLKAASLTQLQSALIIVVAHAVSRSFSVSFIFNLKYVADAESSKSKPLATRLSALGLLFTMSWAALMLAFIPWQMAVASLICLVILRVILQQFYIRQIGGYTGDTLGAAQQLSELIIYLSCIAVTGTLL
ncbi:adenosylcobinamide-GDP ribazoletransferase [Corallincola spongiicola]|uniref:Adenosylcobinamide-GDP ribazoletransferase n=1 Tax=Corallincola spongiicola TaxID=2520508 RepID=A0ABY1WSY4_9GAMM|nr:adenosylcobinamide-GDP ribazoletransferase [Corallincola spongiicola]TAA47676.1 adenosylcobinamide-GDP ribazoletransferase [Corallincola spongiicola]